MKKLLLFLLKELGKLLLVILVAALVVFGIILLELAVNNHLAYAERQLSLENGTLTVRVDVMKVQNVPKEITNPDDAFKLVTGQMEKKVIEDMDGERIYSFAFPWIKSMVAYEDPEIRYQDGVWTTSLLPRFAEHNDYPATFFRFWVPALLIMLIGIANLLPGSAIKTGVAFYLILLTGVVSGTLVGRLTDVSTGMIIGTFLIIAGIVPSGIAWLVNSIRKLIWTAKVLKGFGQYSG